MEREGDDLVLRVHDLAALPSRLSLIAGDVVHNARSALDHLVLALASQGQGALGREPTYKEERSLYFPVCLTEAKFRKAEVSLRRFLADEILRRVELLQPYILGMHLELEASGESKKEAFTAASTLHRLNLLDNADKHRRLALTLWFPDSVDETLEHDDQAGDLPVRPVDQHMPELSDPITESELAMLEDAVREFRQRPDGYDFYFSGENLTEGAEIGRYMRHDRKRMPDVGPIEVELRVVLYEGGLTGELMGAPSALSVLEGLINKVDLFCLYIEFGVMPG